MRAFRFSAAVGLPRNLQGVGMQRGFVGLVLGNLKSRHLLGKHEGMLENTHVGRKWDFPA